MYIRAPSGTLRLQGAEIKKAKDFKYLESTGHVEWEKSDKGHKVAEEEEGDDCWSKQANGSVLCRNFDSLLKVQRVLFGLIYDFFLPVGLTPSQLPSYIC